MPCQVGWTVTGGHGAWFTRYHSCPACGARTANDRRTTLNAPTELMTGLERIETACTHCGHREVHHRTLPRITRSHAGSHRAGGSGGGGGGGGHTAGRGGGGGW
jgi:uncharacterized protein